MNLGHVGSVSEFLLALGVFLGNGVENGESNEGSRGIDRAPDQTQGRPPVHQNTIVRRRLLEWKRGIKT